MRTSCLLRLYAVRAAAAAVYSGGAAAAAASEEQIRVMIILLQFSLHFSQYQIVVQKRCVESRRNLARIPSEVAAASFSSLLLWGARYQYS